MTAPVVPDAVRSRALASGAGAWLEQLPELIKTFEAEWHITVGRSYSGGSEAFVADATLQDGSPAVLKLLLPHDSLDATSEIRALELANGEGCVRLFRADFDRRAMLLERLGPALGTQRLATNERFAILVSLAQKLWRPAPESGLMTGAEKGRWLTEFIALTWESCGRPCSERAVAFGLDCIEHRIAAHDSERALLVHGDLHQWNALQSGDGYKLIDPDGLLTEPEYDLGLLLREESLEVAGANPRWRANWLAERTGRDAIAIWEWGLAETLSSGLLCISIGMQEPGAAMLAAVEAASQTG